jgi:NagD protein
MEEFTDERYSVICDLDGVLHRASQAIPGAARFVKALKTSGRKYLFLTNSPDQSPLELRKSLQKFGIDIAESCFYTAAQGIADFLVCHAKCPRVFLVGSNALKEELKGRGMVLTDRRPDFVVFTSGGPYGLKEINQAVQLILKGAKFITANAERNALSEKGVRAGSGALIGPIERATHSKAYVIGKPNHFMIRAVEARLKIDPLRSIMIGDNLDTDINAGMQAQMKTILVLSGITTIEALERSPYKPDYVVKKIGDIRLEELP